MDGIASPPALQLFRGSSEVVYGSSVDELEFTFQRRGNHQTGDALNNQAKPLLTLSQGFLGAPAFRDIYYGANNFFVASLVLHAL